MRAQRPGCAVVLALGLIIICGIGIGMAIDYVNADPTPALRWFANLPPALRIMVLVFIGVPLAAGVGLYIVLQLADLLDLVSRPIVWAARQLRRG